MATQLDATELLIWRAACLEDRGMSFEKEAAMAKNVCFRRGHEGCSTQIYEGTNEIQRLVIARNLL